MLAATFISLVILFSTFNDGFLLSPISRHRIRSTKQTVELSARRRSGSSGGSFGPDFLSDMYGGSELSSSRGSGSSSSGSGSSAGSTCEEASSKECRCCYFDRSSPCSGDGYCPFDNRPCNANRNYFDHLYGSDGIANSVVMSGSLTSERVEGAKDKPDSEGVLEVEEESNTQEEEQQEGNEQQAEGEGEEEIDPDNIMQMRHVMESQMWDIHQRMTRRERRLRRQKLFLMSNWLDDLLPDPTQGKSWMLNMAVDFAKIVTRATIFVVSFGTVPPTPRSLQ